MGMADISNAIDTGGTIAATIFNPIMQHLTNKQNLKIAAANRNFAYNMWQENNAYNTPSAQKQRLIDAGYNPNMFEASSNVSNAPAQTIDMPQMQAPQVDGSSFSRAFQDYLSKLNTKNIIARTKADISRSYAEKNYFDSQSNRIDMLLPLEAKQLHSTIEKNVADKEFVQKNKDWVDRMNQSTLDVNSQSIKEMKQHIRTMASQANLSDKQANYVVQQAIYQVLFNDYLKKHGYNVDANPFTKVGNFIVNLIDKMTGFDGSPSLSEFLSPFGGSDDNE